MKEKGKLRKVALVTGVSHGLGLALARALLRAGYSVVGVSRSDPPPRVLAKSKQDGSFQWLPCDVSCPSQVHKTFVHVAEKFGFLTVLVNNAGIGKFAPLSETTIELWKDSLETNLSGAFYCIREAVPLLQKGGGGLIVNMTSVAAKYGLPNLSAYSASKSGLLGLTRSLAAELRQQNIHLCSVVLGATDTPFWDTAAHPQNWDRRSMLDPKAVARILTELIRSYPEIVTEEITLLPAAGIL